MLEATPKRVGWAEITLVEPDIDNAIEGNLMTQSATNESGNPYRDASSMGTTGAPARSAAYAVPAAEHTKTASRIGTRFIPWHHGRAPRFCALWASTVLIVLAWALATGGPAHNRSLPSPGEVWQALLALHSEGLLLPSIGVSLYRVSLGVALGVVTAVPAGIIAGSSTIGHAIMDKPIHMLRAVPFPALSPLLIVLLGIGETMKVALIAIGAFALIYVNVRDGVRGIDPKLLELAQAYHLPKRTVFAKILLRGTLPRFMTGLRFALTVSWIALVTCETVNSSAGIGYILSRSQQFYRTDQMVLCIVLYAFLGLFSEWLVGALERLVVPCAH